ncbi:MAG: Gfo/Idh/MocA family oxidoreductase [Planctomycetales bacterium]|nr:Gfo/Idh/MocA family oxidoreductase [Planctomycetales bacterium]
MNPEQSSSAGTRRDFLRTTAAAAALAAPTIVPASVFGAAAPSNRITLGCIGLGNQGYPVMQRFLENEQCQVLAVCDVNRGSDGYKNEGQLLGREPAREAVEKHYGKSKSGGGYKGCDAYNDFREILARGDIDAVVIAAPDHWHSTMTVQACEAGKDVYCEKPLGLTIADQQAMVRAVREHNRVLQTGSHERSNPNVRKVVELVRSGAIGKVKRVVANVGRHNMIGPGPGWQPMPVPEGFDYDMWLGPAPTAPYHQDRCLYRFRFNYDYAGGQVTNFGAHSLDIAQWGLGMDDSGPVEVESIYAEFLPKGSLFNAATFTHFRCKYPGGVSLECVTGEPSVRCVFEGTEGLVRIDNQGREFVTIPSDLKSDRFGDDVPEVYASNDDHQRNFIDCVKSRTKPAAPVEVGHRSATVCHIGNIALRLGKKLKWDPQAERFVGSEAANNMLSRPVRESWKPSAV